MEIKNHHDTMFLLILFRHEVVFISMQKASVFFYIMLYSIEFLIESLN